MSNSEASDADLIRSIMSGKNEDFRILMERYQQKIFSYLYRFLYENRDAAEDVTQSVFLKVYQNLASVDLDRPLQPWIYRIAHNEAANHIRSSSRRKESQLEDDQWNRFSDKTETDSYEENESRELILQSLDKLKPKYREVVVLHYFEDKSYEEIARILDTSVNTVGTLLRRGRLQLEKLLKTAGMMVSMVFTLISRLPLILEDYST